MSAIQVFLLYINHSEFSWYIKHCPLLSRGPLLGASVNGELTVAHKRVWCRFFGPSAGLNRTDRVTLFQVPEQ